MELSLKSALSKGGNLGQKEASGKVYKYKRAQWEIKDLSTVLFDILQSPLVQGQFNLGIMMYLISHIDIWKASVFEFW